MINTLTQRKVFIETYGCQMNEYDTELVRSILVKAQYVLVNKEEDADIVLLNTCAVRENVHRKVYGRIHSLRHEHDGCPVRIGVLGCMATNLRQEFLENAHLHIDFITGPDSYKKFPQFIEEATQTGEKAFDVTLSEFETYSDVYPTYRKGVNARLAEEWPVGYVGR